MTILSSSETLQNIRLRLIYLHDQNLSWREIARLPEYRGINHATLAAIARGRGVPKKWWRHFGLREFVSAPACPDCGKAHVIEGVCPLKTPVRVVRSRPREYHDLFSIPTAELRRMIEERSEA